MLRNKILLFILYVLFAISTFAQNGLSTWYELGFSKKIVKNLKIEFNPELRLFGGFKMDTYILEGGLSYKLHKYLTLAGYYRHENAYDYKKSTGAYKGQKPSSRLAFDAKSGFNLNRFAFQFRLRYTNGVYQNNEASEFRYRAKIDYDIKGSKFSPYASVELFHDRSIPEIEREFISGGLKSIDKIRYTGGISYKINKNNELNLFYRLQDNRFKDETANILGLGYSLDF
jgi:hypothetical protein